MSKWARHSGHCLWARMWCDVMAGDNGGKEWREDGRMEGSTEREWKGSILPSLSLPITQFGSWCVCSCPVLSVLNQSLSLSLSLHICLYLHLLKSVSSSSHWRQFDLSSADTLPPSSFFLTSVKNFLPFLTHSVTLSPSPSLLSSTHFGGHRSVRGA